MPNSIFARSAELRHDTGDAMTREAPDSLIAVFELHDQVHWILAEGTETLEHGGQRAVKFHGCEVNGDAFDTLWTSGPQQPNQSVRDDGRSFVRDCHSAQDASGGLEHCEHSAGFQAMRALAADVLEMLRLYRAISTVPSHVSILIPVSERELCQGGRKVAREHPRRHPTRSSGALA